MKIAYCLPDDTWIDSMRRASPRNAAHIQQKYITEGLRARGHSLTFVAPRGVKDIVYAREMDPLQRAARTWTTRGWFEMPSKAVWKLQQIFGLPYLNIFSNYRRMDACLQILPGHEVVFERNSLYNDSVARACRKLALPYVIFFDADQITELAFMGKPLRGWLLWRARRLLRANLSASRQVICVSEAARDHLLTRWHMPADKIVVLPNAVDIRRFRPDPELRAETRAALQSANHPLIIFVGGFYPWHDVITLLNAFRQVLQNNSSARLVLVGEGPEHAKLRNHAENIGIRQAVHFAGGVDHDQVARYINAADIAVVPAPMMEQAFWLSPMKLFEYMAAGKAIVASAMGQIADVVKHCENGMLVRAGDPGAMAEMINRLLSDPELRARLGEQARSHVVRSHSWDHYLTRLEHILNDSISYQTRDNL